MLQVELITAQAEDSFQLAYLLHILYCVLALIDTSVSTYLHSLSFKSFFVK